MQIHVDPIVQPIVIRLENADEIVNFLTAIDTFRGKKIDISHEEKAIVLRFADVLSRQVKNLSSIEKLK